MFSFLFSQEPSRLSSRERTLKSLLIPDHIEGSIQTGVS